jgi:hypothetical protein
MVAVLGVGEVVGYYGRWLALINGMNVSYFVPERERETW